MPLQCPNCDTLLIEGARQCPACLHEIARTPHAPPTTPAATTPPAARRKKSRGPEVLIEVVRADAARFPGHAVEVAATLAGEGHRINEARADLVCVRRFKTQVTDPDGSTRYVWQEQSSLAHGALLMGRGEMPADFERTYNFSWAIPEDALPSCAGRIARVRWLVRGHIDIPLGFDVVREVELKVAAPLPVESAAPGECGEMAVEANLTQAAADFGTHGARRTSYEGVSLRFLLPKLGYAEGESIEGVLHVRAAEDLDARGVSVWLARFERVGGNVEQRPGPKVSLASGGRLRAGVPVAYRFALPVEAGGCPTLAAEEGTVEWFLVAALERPLFSRDFVGLQKIFVAAAAPSPRTRP